MIDSKYSKAVFEAAGINTPESAAIASALEDEIRNELSTVIQKSFLEIVHQLNTMGHNLREYIPSTPGEMSYRDDSGIECTNSYSCGLRVAVDYIVSTGYCNLAAECFGIDPARDIRDNINDECIKRSEDQP